VGLIHNSEKDSSNKGRGFGRIEKVRGMDATITSEQMDVKAILNQDFEKYLEKNGYNLGKKTFKSSSVAVRNVYYNASVRTNASPGSGTLYKSATASDIFISDAGNL
jgi:hypothetical protein